MRNNAAAVCSQINKSPTHTTPHAAAIHVEAHVQTAGVHVSIVHVLVVREEFHKAPRLHPRVDTWTGTTQACVEQPETEAGSAQSSPLVNAVMYSTNLLERANTCLACLMATGISKINSIAMLINN